MFFYGISWSGNGTGALLTGHDRRTGTARSAAKPQNSVKNRCQTACKPGSVPRARPEAMAIHLGRPSPGASRDPPRRRRGNPRGQAKPGRPPLLGLAPGGVYRAAAVAGSAVRSYRTLSPLPVVAEARAGGLLSAALSLGFPPPGVTRHRVSMEPGLSSPGRRESKPEAAIRPSGPVYLRAAVRPVNRPPVNRPPVNRPPVTARRAAPAGP